MIRWYCFLMKINCIQGIFHMPLWPNFPPWPCLDSQLPSNTELSLLCHNDESGRTLRLRTTSFFLGGVDSGDVHILALQHGNSEKPSAVATHGPWTPCHHRSPRRRSLLAPEWLGKIWDTSWFFIVISAAPPPSQYTWMCIIIVCKYKYKYKYR